MPKANEKEKIVTKDNPVLATTPWSCTHFGGQSEIEAFISSTGKWKTIADVHSIGDIDAEDIADFITQVVNEYSHSRGK